MTISPLVKINFAVLLLLFFAIFITYKMISGDPTKDAWKQIKNKTVKKVVVLLIRSFFVLALIGCIIFINIPVLRDTFSRQKPITLIGKVEFSDRGLFFPLWYWFSQSFRIDDVSLNIHFYPKIIIKGKTYKVTYLPYSKSVLTIEETAPLQPQIAKEQEPDKPLPLWALLLFFLITGGFLLWAWPRTSFGKRRRKS